MNKRTAWWRGNARLSIKRAMDLVFGSLASVLLSPVLVVLAVMVRVSMGRPVLFRQERLGYQERVFVLLKFRTMTEARDDTGQYLPDDERITRLGQVLRSSSLDEVPELLNLIKGDISLVGPRPLPVRYRDRYNIEQQRRHQMPPGMAGPVMAQGRNSLSWHEKFRYDLEYVDNWTLRLDFKLFALSVVKALSREGVTPEGRATMEEFLGEQHGTESSDE